jgi:hypothetical protein
MRRHLFRLAWASPVVLLIGWGLFLLRPSGAADEPQPSGAQEARGTDATGDRAAASWTTAVEPKPLSPSVKKGLDWLVEHQLPEGAWGQGEESAQMGGGGALKDRPSVADTCIAALALIRSGSTPRTGPYRDAIAKAVRFVRAQIEESDAQSLSVTSAQGTRVQQKLGPHIDTFLASMLLAEVKGRMPDDEGERGVDLALTKVLDKIQRHQKADGSFEGQAWAPILAQAMCGKGLNRARQAGEAVPQMALARAENSAKLAFAAPLEPTASVGGGSLGGPVAISSPTSPIVVSAPVPARLSFSGGDAGVELYSRAASVGVLQDSVNTNKTVVAALRDKADRAPDPKARVEARNRLAEIDEVEAVQKAAQGAVIERLNDPQFVAGFGSNGGEEFLSYMTLAESLVVKGGDEWTKWDAQMTGNLDRVQNGDGSWSGHHCITGRTFCTSAALLVLMADRTPIPVQAKDDGKAKDDGRSSSK